ncbi:S-layer homology domain-containing protein [Cohnella rhizosphaerae]|uniref:S-layer homology domain-containing protein n=1 Tax=Cohnella rhizosphaerae TaxID=1457232 RepID=A0A9X4QU51_9BACL|nr:S-layer homology domain-containing protein [Cohnella rhizosphaerae]MDG0811375.1 S-layer homology domain-containing protein [Cohnella rhizosphaerae]
MTQAGSGGIRFTVDKFSTFTIVHIDGEKPSQLKAYVQGYADGTFGPERGITRAEMAAILTRVSGNAENTEKQAGKSYTDVSAGHWAKDAIVDVTKAGLMDGYPDGSFKPGQTMTRAEMAKIAARMLATTPGGNGSFSDISGHWAQSAIELAKAAGIIGGYSDGSFRPDQTLTRAEAVAMISKLSGRAPLSEAPAKWRDVPKSHWAFGFIQEASIDHDDAGRQ